jgi:hypothetical protein
MKGKLINMILLCLLALTSSIRLSTNLSTMPVYKDRIASYEYLNTNEYLRSPKGVYTFWLGNDGNLVVYGCTGATWSSGTNNSTNARRLSMQGDGNLVLREGTTVIWSSKSQNKGTAPYRLQMQNDGNLVIYDTNSLAVWSSKSQGKDGSCAFVQGEITDQNGSYVSDATVSFKSSTKSVNAEVIGSYYRATVPLDTYVVTVAKTGYVTQATDLTVSSTPVRKDFSISLYVAPVVVFTDNDGDDDGELVENYEPGDPEPVAWNTIDQP